jgi:hypothetical protein
VRRYSEPEIARLAIGRFVGKLVKHAAHNAKADDGVALQLYSAHDSTLVALLCALRLRWPASFGGAGEARMQPFCPPYASHLQMEVYECDKDGVAPGDIRIQFTFNGQYRRFFHFD